jgi:hypothetical protein
MMRLIGPRSRRTQRGAPERPLPGGVRRFASGGLDV